MLPVYPAISILTPLVFLVRCLLRLKPNASPVNRRSLGVEQGIVRHAVSGRLSVSVGGSSEQKGRACTTAESYKQHTRFTQLSFALLCQNAAEALDCAVCLTVWVSPSPTAFQRNVSLSV